MQRGFAHIFFIVFLFLGLVLAVSLVQQKQLFKPKASSDTSASVWLTKSFFHDGGLGAPDTLVVNPGIGIMHYPWANKNKESLDYVSGRAGGPFWKALEPQEGQFNWEPLEKFLEGMSEDRRAWVRIDASYRSKENVVPDWVFASGADFVPFYQNNGVKIPVYWSPIYKSKLESFIQVLARRYDGDVRIAGFEVQGQGEYGEMVPDWERIIYQNDPQLWINKGFTKELWIEHQKWAVDTWMKYFKKTPAAIQIINNDVSWVGSPAKPVLDYVISKYGMRIYPKWSGAGPQMQGVPDIFLQYTPFTQVMYEEQGKYFAWGNYPSESWRQQALNVMGSRANSLYVYAEDFTKDIYEPEMKFLAKYLGPQIFLKTDDLSIPSSASAGGRVNLLIKWGNRGNMPLYKPSNLENRIKGCTACEKDEPISTEAFIDLVNSSNQTKFHYKYTPDPPTTIWYSNVVIDNYVSFTLPDNITEGDYDVRVGLYNPHPSARVNRDSERAINFKLLNSSINDGSDRYTIGRINIQAQTTPFPFELPDFNLAFKKPAFASSLEDDNLTASFANDGDTGTRWASAGGSDDQWFYIDLGREYDIKKVVLKWEIAYGKDYDIKVSNGGGVWRTIFSRRGFGGGIDTITNLSASGRYISVQGVKRGWPWWGYSLWEFEVY